jgi:hypothetical protein
VPGLSIIEEMAVSSDREIPWPKVLAKAAEGVNTARRIINKTNVRMVCS